MSLSISVFRVKALITICVIVHSIDTANPANIGIMAAPYLSHYLFMKNIAKELLRMNHNVAIIIPEYILEVSENTETENLIKITYKSYTNEDFNRHLNLVAEMIYNRGDVRTALIQSNRETCEKILRDAQLYESLQKYNFDLFILDAVPPARLFTILPYRLSVPYIYVGIGYHPWLQSIPHFPSFTPYSPFSLTDKMTLKERILNTVISFIFALVDPFSSRQDVAIFAPEKPFLTMNRLVGLAHFWILDTNEIIDYARPTMPNVKQIGGLGLSLLKPLTGELEQFMDLASEGVVLVSFGSIFKEEKKYLDTFIQSFKLLPYKVVWRVNASFHAVKNVHTSPWLSQNDILAHKNTRAFVTHCGNSGQMEALYNGVPMLGMPLFGDQPYNAARMVSKGFGIQIEFWSVTSNQLVTAITELINNPFYRENIKRASEAYRSRLRNELPRETAAFWIDHVINYGGTYMRSVAQDMVWYEYLSLDIICIYLVIIHIIVFISARITVKFYCFLVRKYRKLKQQ